MNQKKNAKAENAKTNGILDYNGDGEIIQVRSQNMRL